MRNFKKLLSLFMIAILFFELPLYAKANTSHKPNRPNVTWGNGYVTETYTVAIEGKTIDFVRTSYENNTAVLTITEDGIISTSTHAIDYNKLCNNLNNQAQYSQLSRDRIEGYTYTFMRTITDTVYYTPENGAYSVILSGLSIALGATGIPGSTLAAIASLIYGLSASNIETKIEIYRHWYNVTETASGAYICYFCEFNAYTYAKTGSGPWTLLGSESGNFNSFDIY